MQQASENTTASNRKQAEKWLKKCLKSPLISFLFLELDNQSCQKPRISLQCCQNRSGGFSPELGVILCENQLVSKSHMQDTLAHELVHAYDDCTVKMNYLKRDHLACSEIRAITLSGECGWTRELGRGRLSLSKFQDCVKRRAMLGLEQIPLFKSKAEAEEAVLGVFDKCFPDLAPFDEIF